VQSTQVLSAPRTGADVLTTLSKGQLLHVIGEEGDFVEVEFSPGRSGYVLRRDIEAISEEPR
jgi:uncharacterized protein YgiM (DUF1202 family)